MYTDVELAAFDAADEAFAEVRKVAERFAKEINCDYRRSVTTWSSYSTFDVPLLSGCHVSWKPVDHFADDFDGDAYECAVQLVDKWNNAIISLKDKYDTCFLKLDEATSDGECEYWQDQLDVVYDDRAYLLEELGKIVEDWYDSACDFAYESYLDEHAA